MAFPGLVRAFHEVIRFGSIRQASIELSMSPSSVSRQVMMLEHEIGTALLDRTRTGVVPTHAGTLVADFARDVVLNYDALRADLNDLRGSRRQLIRVAVIEGMVCEGAIGAIRRFRERFDEVTFKVTVTNPSEIAQGLKTGDCEVGISYLQQPDEAISIVGRFPDPVVLAASSKHELASRERITLPEIARLPIAAIENDPIDQPIREALAAADLSLRPLLTTNSVEAVRSFVRGGSGVALLSRRTLERDIRLGTLVAIPIDAPQLAQASVDVLTRKNSRLPRVVRLFANDVTEVIQGLAER